MELTGDVGYSTGSFSVRDDQPIAQVPSIAHDASQYIDEVSTTTQLDPTSTDCTDTRACVCVESSWLGQPHKCTMMITLTPMTITVDVHYKGGDASNGRLP